MVWITNGDTGLSVRTKLNTIPNDGTSFLGLQRLDRATPSGTGVVTFNPIVQTYDHLLLKIFGASTAAATFANVLLTFNNDTAANYDQMLIKGSTGGITGGPNAGQTSITVGVVPAATAVANAGGSVVVDITGYAINAAALQKSTTSQSAWKVATSDLTSYANAGWWRSGVPITRLDLTLSSGNWVAGSLVCLYGF